MRQVVAINHASLGSHYIRTVYKAQTQQGKSQKHWTFPAKRLDTKNNWDDLYFKYCTPMSKIKLKPQVNKDNLIRLKSIR